MEHCSRRNLIKVIFKFLMNFFKSVFLCSNCLLHDDLYPGYYKKFCLGAKLGSEHIAKVFILTEAKQFGSPTAAEIDSVFHRESHNKFTQGI